MTTRANLYVDQGIDFLLRLQVVLDENTTEGLAFYSSARKVYSSTKLFDATVTVEENGSEETVDLDLFIGAEKTANKEPGKYQYDVIYTNQNGNVKKLLEGTLYLIPTITKPE